MVGLDYWLFHYKSWWVDRWMGGWLLGEWELRLSQASWAGAGPELGKKKKIKFLGGVRSTHSSSFQGFKIVCFAVFLF